MFHKWLGLGGQLEDPQILFRTWTVPERFPLFEPIKGVRRGAMDEAWFAPTEEMCLNLRLADSPVKRLIYNETHRRTEQRGQGPIPQVPTAYRRWHSALGETNAPGKGIPTEPRNVEMLSQFLRQSGLP
jgi:hypothetical protein